MFIQALLIARKSLHKRSDSSKRDKTSTSSNWTLFKGNKKRFKLSFSRQIIHKICSNAVIILINLFCRVLFPDGYFGPHVDTRIHLFCRWSRGVGNTFYHYKQPTRCGYFHISRHPSRKGKILPS